jgi:HlyD family secretion protein
VDEANVAPVREGQKAQVYVNAFQDETFVGTIDHVGLKMKTDRDGTSYFEADILLELPNGVLLRDGMTANAEVQVETFRDVLKVPSQAVVDYAIDDLPQSVSKDPSVDRTKKFARVVFVVEGGKARVVPVTTGTSDLTDTIITAGLTDDATIVVGPFKTLATLKHEQSVVDEATVKPEAEKSKKAAGGETKERPQG